METWYTDKLDDNVWVLLSNSGYINSELVLIYLDHLIEHMNAGTDKPPKVLLMDQHGSHMDDDFIIKATEKNIHPFPFLDILHMFYNLLMLVFFNLISTGIRRQFNMQCIT